MSSRKLTIALLGARSAGKSSLIKRYCEGKFEDSYFPTIDCSHFESVTVNNITYEFRIIDTAGQPRCNTMARAPEKQPLELGQRGSDQITNLKLERPRARRGDSNGLWVHGFPTGG
ncbi:hypothetical protein B0H11DRAFT_1920839 [Mycena galericulata]|nr:hypothetical protein B0H11DRAFT_1920839 [Mycena galericulata]